MPTDSFFGVTHMYIENTKELSIPEVAKILEVDNTYAYRLVREERLQPVRTSPYRITFAANNYETANLISQLCGNKTVEQTS